MGLRTSRGVLPLRPRLFALAPHRERPLPAQGLISGTAPDLSFPRCPLSMRAGIALRTPRVPARPPSADRPGIAASGVGRTIQAQRPF